MRTGCWQHPDCGRACMYWGFATGRVCGEASSYSPGHASGNLASHQPFDRRWHALRLCSRWKYCLHSREPVLLPGGLTPLVCRVRPHHHQPLLAMLHSPDPKCFLDAVLLTPRLPQVPKNPPRQCYRSSLPRCKYGTSARRISTASCHKGLPVASHHPSAVHSATIQPCSLATLPRLLPGGVSSRAVCLPPALPMRPR